MKKFTFCLNATKADPDTYQTWFTVRFMGDDCGTVECLGNAEGNGQVWNEIASWCYANDTMSIRFTDNDCFATRVIATIMGRKGADCNGAKTFGAAYPQACAVNVTDLRLTAMPSLMAGRPPRDKNVSRKWDEITALTGAAPCYKAAPDAIDAMQATIEANRAAEKAEKAAAKAAGMKIGAYRSLKAAGLV